ncbi:MAG: Holliday junction resolvase RuvX [Alphaproteobacteria bacterium]|nr:Holliday junction resolvase RuvX [Alphaproteobacteria bacterium]
MTSQAQQNHIYLGLDVGSKTIGLALGIAVAGVATPLETIERTKFQKDALKLQEVIKKYNVTALVVGLPLNMDGTEGRRVQSVRDFAAELAKVINLPIYWQDERLSTASVDNFLVNTVDMSRERRGQVVDKLAAQQILQWFLGRV